MFHFKTNSFLNYSVEASRRGIIVTTWNVLRPEMLCTSYSCFLFRRSNLMNWSGMNTAIVSKWEKQTHRKKENLRQSWADAKLIHILSKEENLLNFEYFLTVAYFVHNQVSKEGDGFQETYSTCLTKLRHKPALQLHPFKAALGRTSVGMKVNCQEGH